MYVIFNFHRYDQNLLYYLIKKKTIYIIGLYNFQIDHLIVGFIARTLIIICRISRTTKWIEIFVNNIIKDKMDKIR